MNDFSAMTHSTVSIIIPTYNSERTLGNCLNSIVIQSDTVKEVIIVDGKSTDSTVQIIRRYAAGFPYFRYVSEKDSGIYDAMNKGIVMAQGEWLYFLGSDDELYDQHVIADFRKAVQHTTAKLVYGNVRLVGNSAMGKDGDLYDGAFNLKKLFEKNISHQAIFYARSVFGEIGNFNIKYSTCADWDFNHRCFAVYETRYIGLIVSKFVTGGLSSSHGGDIYTEEECIFRLKENHKIGFFNSLFKTYSWVFANHAFKERNQRNLKNFFYYYFLYFKHSDSKAVILKTVLKKFLSQFRSLSSQVHNKNLYFI